MLLLLLLYLLIYLLVELLLRRGPINILLEALIGSSTSHHLLLHHDVGVGDLRPESHINHLIIDHIDALRHLVLLHHLLLAWRHHTWLSVPRMTSLVHVLLLLSHCEILIILHLLLRRKSSLHRLLHVHHVLLLLLILHLHLLLIVLILISQRLVEIPKIEIVLL